MHKNIHKNTKSNVVCDVRLKKLLKIRIEKICDIF